MTQSGGTRGRVVAGRYRLGDVLGRGGMGTVWRAVDEMLHRDVAVKELRLPEGLDDEERELQRERTLREARAAARVQHENIVTIYDVVEDGGIPWIVMELVEAESLAEVLRASGTLTPADAADVGLRVLRAVVAAEAKGVLHRDIKPANILVTAQGRVVLTDFGIATVTGTATLTATGMLVGSPDFLAPERAEGRRPALAADLWSLGLVLYMAVEGRNPFHRQSMIGTLNSILQDEPDPPRHAGPLAPVIEGWLRKDPERRMSAQEGERMLLAVLAGRTSAAAPAAAPAGEETAISPGALPSPGEQTVTAVAGPYIPPGPPPPPPSHAPTPPPASPTASRPPAAHSPMPQAPAAPTAQAPTAQQPPVGASPQPYGHPTAARSVPPGPATGAQHPAAQYPGGQYSGAQYSGAQYPAAQYSGAQYSGAQYPGAPGHGVPTGTQQPGPRQPGAGPARGRTGRMVAVVALVLALVAGGVVVALVLNQGDDEPGGASADGTVSASPTATATSGPTSPSPSASASRTTASATRSTATSGPASLTYTPVVDPAGFRMLVPQGWKRQVTGTGKDQIDFVDPTGKVLLRIGTTPVGQDPYGNFQTLEKASKSRYKDYERITLERQGTNDALWEFTWTGDPFGKGASRRAHAIDLGLVSAQGRDFAIYVAAFEENWDEAYQVFLKACQDFADA